MVAFVGAVIVAIAMSAGIVRYARRRPVGTPLSWGEAMVAATYVFFLLFWVYGIVPHQLLTLTEAELKWRTDSILIGPGSTAWGPLKDSPVVLSKATVSDTLVVLVYGLGLAGHVAMWSIWQNRGKQKSAEIETSRYGRPLVKA